MEEDMLELIRYQERALLQAAEDEEHISQHERFSIQGRPDTGKLKNIRRVSVTLIV